MPHLPQNLRLESDCLPPWIEWNGRKQFSGSGPAVGRTPGQNRIGSVATRHRLALNQFQSLSRSTRVETPSPELWNGRDWSFVLLHELRVILEFPARGRCKELVKFGKCLAIPGDSPRKSSDKLVLPDHICFRNWRRIGRRTRPIGLLEGKKPPEEFRRALTSRPASKRKVLS